MELEFYNWTVKIDFDEQKHTYKLWNKIIPSVSKISWLSEDNEFLFRWKVNQFIERVIWTYQVKERTDAVLSQALAFMRKTDRDALFIGTEVHNWIEKFIKWEDTPLLNTQESYTAVSNFEEWWKSKEYEMIALEKPVYSKKHNYVGTCDFIWTNKDWEVVFIDWKTSASINRRRYWMQVAGYIRAFEEENLIPVSKAYVVRLDKKTGKIQERKVDVDHYGTLFLFALAILKG